MNPSAIAHLCKCEPRFAAHVERIGPITLQKAEYTDPFVALLRSITYQQLAGNAARAIWLRVLALFEGAMPSAESLLRLSDETLRSAGLSRSKAAAMRDIATKRMEGLVPTARSIARMKEERIYEQLVQIRGVGPWTVEMLLIFGLRRPDVMPGSDYGVRKGVQVLYGRRTLPTPRQVLRYAERWRPHRTTAALYLWRIAESAPRKRNKKRATS